MLGMIAFAAFHVPVSEQPNYLAVDGLVIAIHSSGNWRQLKTISSLSQKVTFTKVGIGMTNGSWTASEITQGESAFFVNQGPSGVLYSGSVSVPRPVKILSNSNSTYLAVLGKYLRAHGITSPPRLTRVVMTDLDGNGTQDVMLEASSRPNVSAGPMNSSKSGDYSLVLLRFEGKAKVEEYPLSFEHPPAGSTIGETKIMAVADFDADGVMEIALMGKVHEGQSGILFQYKGSTVKKLAEVSVDAGG